MTAVAIAALSVSVLILLRLHFIQAKRIKRVEDLAVRQTADTWVRILAPCLLAAFCALTIAYRRIGRLWTVVGLLRDEATTQARQAAQQEFVAGVLGAEALKLHAEINKLKAQRNGHAKSLEVSP